MIESALRVTDNQLRHRARIVRQLAPVPPVQGNPSKLSQVFINLLVNAAQSIEEGPAQTNTITVRTATVPGWVEAYISDSGAGIAGEQLERVFEPFHTTKPIGEGTGLGLAICREIVTAHHGEISIDSRVGVGSTICVRLPIVTELPAPPSPDEPEAPSRITPPTPGAPNRRSVLVIDDDALVGRVLRRGLGKNHDVTVVNSGAAALALLSAGHRYDMAFCDVMMPEMTGIELYREVAQRWPDFAASMVFMTGGVFTTAGQDFLEEVRNRCVYKPFDMKALDLIVREGP